MVTDGSVITPPPEEDNTATLNYKPKPLMPASEFANALSMIKEQDDEYEQDTDHVRKQYENMSCNEISQRLAESYKQLSEMLGSNMVLTPSSTSSDKTDIHTFDIPDEDDLDDENSLVERSDLDADTRKSKMTKLFYRAASSGDLPKVTRLLSEDRYRQWIDIDAKDDDGTTPLIYAACFGKTDIAQALLSAGAKTDIQDSFGWSALMWATNNSHGDLVKVLLEHGASSQTKSAKGRTVFDFINTDNQKIVDILATNPRDSISSTSSILGRTAGSLSSSSSNAGDCDFYYQSTVEAFDSFMAEEADRRQKLLATAAALVDGSHGADTQEDAEDDLDNDDDSLDGDTTLDLMEFRWDKCMPDQMFVFAADDLEYILDTIITNIQLPVRSQQEICVPANVVFLSARFAHYFSSDELLHEVLDGALERMSQAIKANTRNVHVLAFWITNFTQILYYLKKDTGLVVATAEYQLRLSELISETYTMIVNDTERRLSKILRPAMLEHEEIPGMDNVDFADDWHRFFRRSSRRSVIVPPDGGMAVQMKGGNQASSNAMVTISPHSITSLLSSTLYVLQSYDVHPTVIIQALAQFFHFMSCELFNHILTNKKLLCRSKALQIRLNLSKIEDWITQNNLPGNLTYYLNPTMQLLQLLQCLTQLNELPSFINTVRNFDMLNALQIKRCVVNYRYEVNEPRLLDEIEKYVVQLAEDTVRLKQARQSRSLDKARRSVSMSRTQSLCLQRSASRRDSMSSFVGSFMSSVGLTTSASLPCTPVVEHAPSLPIKEESAETSMPSSDDGDDSEDDEDDGKEIEETRDSKFMLPFSVPTTAHMVSMLGWSPEDPKRDIKERQVVPVIPEEWMDRLDKGHQS
ncbi:uncharacterized protein BYT42DRAFT_618186 [Radiomyces spectabilis]|uniref:uncharacterized protein n=1 Tax=Radiomyces spectabilis TaxID=64574 RepID=UPI00221E4838|nr:uncharacterized protein BYT42DRAFT_618186 [Radiomyces spectabilis]KAI8366680.1 hypothetical protein BYT42DRAFT_618186 [Radiomyces spectabilis]